VSWCGYLVLSLLVMSFAYELPLINISRFDRLNPRLFDVSAGVFVMYWLFAGRKRGWRLRLRVPVVWPWFWVTLFFGLATLFSVFWIPYDTYLYSIFFFLKYLEAFIVVLIFASIPFSNEVKRKLVWVALLGGAWVSFYALLQYFGIVSTQRFLPTGKEIALFEKGIYSTLGVTYFHVGMFGVLSCLIGFALFVSSTNYRDKILALLLTLLCFVPAMISGSKAGLLGLGIALILIMMQREYRSRFGAYILVLLVVAGGYLFYTKSVARQRLEEGSGGKPAQRLLMGFESLRDIYEYHGPRMLAVGGGFYVVPATPRMGGKPKYRVGYGNHNIFLFPLEQAGIGAFIAAIGLWVSVAIGLWRRVRRSARDSLDGAFAASMRCYFITLMIVGIAGQVFFLGFGTEHFTVYQLLLFILAISPSMPGRERVATTPYERTA